MIGRATGAFRKHAASLGIGGDGAPRPGAIDPRPVLMWLAGAGYRPKEVARLKGLLPLGRARARATDAILAIEKPDDPVLAAGMRADTLATLHREAPTDPRVKGIFETDPVIAADPETGWIVTESMLAARIGLFDSINTLLGKSYLSENACLAMRTTLVSAFHDLATDSQREWCHSEVRLEQGLAFLEGRSPDDLIALADTLGPVDAERGIWATVRLFGIAAQMGLAAEGSDLDAIAPLLKMDA